jgi:purine-binding chemotaxis protein CheW
METAETLSNQFLTFALGDDIFAVDVLAAREILDYSDVTRVPQTPEYMLGVINLRGNVVPVIDMRLKFGMVDIEKTRDSCVIVMEVDVDGNRVVVGALADSVSEVLDLLPSQIEPAPRIGTRLNTEFIKGMGNLGEKFVIILDINKVFSSDELAIVQAVGGPNED